MKNQKKITGKIVNHNSTFVGNVYFDKNIIDKIVNGFGRSSLSVGRIFVRSFNGEIQFYSFVMILGLLVCQIIIFVISYYVLGS